jgi:signal peptidase I
VGEPLKRNVGRLMVLHMKLLFLVVLVFVWGAFVASGQTREKTPATGSMLPSIPINSILVVDESSYSNRSPSRFDIVVARREYRATPESDLASMEIVARVVGLPGEVISIRRGRVYVNGRWQKNLFQQDPVLLKMMKAFHAGRCQQFGSQKSEDSRLWSPKTIPLHDVLGKVVDIIPRTATPNQRLQLTAR